MENKKNKCSSKEHKEIDANAYCPICNIYMCSKCDNYHSSLFEFHNSYKLDKDIKEIFTGLCKYKIHKNELEFYCKTHNELCCSVCISKIKTKGKGQHTDCNVCLIKDIKEEKQSVLSENVKFLEKMSQNIEEMIKKLKETFEKINKDKEELKLEIQKIFTKIRNIINNREDELLIEVDEKFNREYFSENLIKDSEKLPNKIKTSLDIRNEIDKNEKLSDENKLRLLINSCIIIENNIKEIKVLNEKIKESNSLDKIQIKFLPEENEVDKYFGIVNNFGKIEKLGNESKFFDNSDILNDDEKKLLILWLPKKPKKITLLLNSNKDGDSVEVIKKKCKNKYPTIVVLMTIKGIKFGGYTTQEWKNEITKDNDAFVFSLDKKKKYKIIKPNNATYLSTWWGFGPDENAIVICNNCTESNSNFVGNKTYYIKEKYELNGGEEYFTVKSFEIYLLEN